MFTSFLHYFSNCSDKRGPQHPYFGPSWVLTCCILHMDMYINVCLCMCRGVSTFFRHSSEFGQTRCLFKKEWMAAAASDQRERVRLKSRQRSQGSLESRRILKQGGIAEETNWHITSAWGFLTRATQTSLKSIKRFRHCMQTLPHSSMEDMTWIGAQELLQNTTNSGWTVTLIYRTFETPVREE